MTTRPTIIIIIKYLNADIIGAAALTKGHGDGLVDEVRGAVGGNAGHGPGPILGLPAFDSVKVVTHLQ